MKNFSRLLGLVMIATALLLTALLFSSKNALPQGKVPPGTLPIKSREDAIAAGRTQASFNLAKGATEQKITLQEVTRLNPSGYKATLAKYGVEDNPLYTQLKNDVSKVVFSGRFTPKHLHFAAGSEPKIPIYTTLEVYLSADDGIPIHIRMSDQISPPQ
jgi:hypothetical protein